MTETSTLSGTISPTRQKILMLLKKGGGMTASELGDRLKITSMGVRRHLITMERDGLVQYDEVQRGLGRPSYVYSMTSFADDLFPKNYWQLANELLQYVESSEGEEKVEALFYQRAERRIRQARQRLNDRDLPQQVAELARILQEDGYLAEWSQLDEDTWYIQEHNCAVHQVAQRYDQVCVSELFFIRSVLTDAEVNREQHLMNGDRLCGYVIRRRKNRE